MDITTGLFGLFLLACAYSVQYWAMKCYDEPKTIREQLEKR